VQNAFRQTHVNSPIFILPKRLNDQDCYAVMWGPFSSKQAVHKALSDIPEFFTQQTTKPEIVLLKSYL